MIRYNPDPTNKTIGSLRYFDEKTKISVYVQIGYPAEMNANTIQRLLDAAFQEVERRVIEAKIMKAGI